MKKRIIEKSSIEKTVLLLFVVSAASLVLDHYTDLSINNSIVHFIVSYIALTALPLAITVYFFGFKTINAVLIILGSMLAVCFLISFLTWSGEWKTQTIIYRDHLNPDQTIEFRMRADRFAMGYQKQIVSRKKILPFLDLVTGIDTSKIDPSKWTLVNEKVNELNLPGEYVDLPLKEK